MKITAETEKLVESLKRAGLDREAMNLSSSLEGASTGTELMLNVRHALGQLPVSRMNSEMLKKRDEIVAFIESTVQGIALGPRN